METPEKTAENARAAHDFFAPALMETIRVQAEAMARSMSPTRPSSEILPELKEIDSSARARRRELHD